MAGNDAGAIAVGKSVGPFAAGMAQLAARLPEYPWRTMLGEMLLDGLPGGLWKMQQKVDGIRLAATRLLRRLYATRRGAARELIWSPRFAILPGAGRRAAARRDQALTSSASGTRVTR
jgi:hypothetical protein